MGSCTTSSNSELTANDVSSYSIYRANITIRIIICVTLIRLIASNKSPARREQKKRRYHIQMYWIKSTQKSALSFFYVNACLRTMYLYMCMVYGFCVSVCVRIKCSSYKILTHFRAQTNQINIECNEASLRIFAIYQTFSSDSDKYEIIPSFFALSLHPSLLLEWWILFSFSFFLSNINKLFRLHCSIVCVMSCLTDFISLAGESNPV